MVHITLMMMMMTRMALAPRCRVLQRSFAGRQVRRVCSCHLFTHIFWEEPWGFGFCQDSIEPSIKFHGANQTQTFWVFQKAWFFHLFPPTFPLEFHSQLHLVHRSSLDFAQQQSNSYSCTSPRMDDCYCWPNRVAFQERVKCHKSTVTWNQLVWTLHSGSHQDTFSRTHGHWTTMVKWIKFWTKKWSLKQEPGKLCFHTCQTPLGSPVPLAGHSHCFFGRTKHIVPRTHWALCCGAGPARTKAETWSRTSPHATAEPLVNLPGRLVPKRNCWSAATCAAKHHGVTWHGLRKHQACATETCIQILHQSQSPSVWSPRHHQIQAGVALQSLFVSQEHCIYHQLPLSHNCAMAMAFKLLFNRIPVLFRSLPSRFPTGSFNFSVFSSSHFRSKLAHWPIGSPLLSHSTDSAWGAGLKKQHHPLRSSKLYQFRTHCDIWLPFPSRAERHEWPLVDQQQAAHHQQQRPFSNVSSIYHQLSLSHSQINGVNTAPRDAAHWRHSADEAATIPSLNPLPPWCECCKVRFTWILKGWGRRV